LKAERLVVVVETKTLTEAGFPPLNDRFAGGEAPGTPDDDMIIVWFGITYALLF
jgi:hypothetical protein